MRLFTHRQSNNPALGVLGASDEDNTDEQSNRTRQLQNPDKQLEPPCPFDSACGLGAHRLHAGLAIRHDEIAIRMLIEVYQGSIWLWLWRSWLPASFSDCLGIEVGDWVFFGRIVKVWLARAPHCVFAASTRCLGGRRRERENWKVLRTRECAEQSCAMLRSHGYGSLP
jgi:hypothetical protein